MSEPLPITCKTVNSVALANIRKFAVAEPNHKYRQLRLLTLLFLFLGNTALADDSAQHYRIPAQSLNNALMQFAADANLKLLFSDAKVSDLNAKPLDGILTPKQALEQLLQGSGYTYRFIDEHTVTLEKARTPPASQLNSSDPITLPKVSVVGNTINDVKDPYNEDYLLPNATSGTKTDTPIMETPLNVQVISKQVLKDQQVIRLDQALNNVSGVTTISGNDSGNGDAWFLRGFQTNTLFRNGFRMDNFNGFANSQQFANVESVEVLKGPAAILYGRVEPGGMVNIVTKQPKATPYYSLTQQFGSYDLFRTSIDATSPLTKDDTLLYRMNASFQSNNTFRDQIKNEDVFLAPIMKWNISPRTQATLEMEYQHQNTNFDYQVLPFANNKLQNLPPNRNLNERNPLEIEEIFAGLNWSHQFNDDWAIKHQVNFKRRDQNLPKIVTVGFINLDNRQADRTVSATHINNDTIATILDLTGHFKTGFLDHTLLLGGDYYRADFLQKSLDMDYGNDPVTVSSINIDNPIHPGQPDLNPHIRSSFKQNVDNYGLYLQDQIKLPYNVHVMGGFRYQYIHQVTQSGDANGIFTIADYNPPTTADAVTPRVGLLWQAQKWLTLYSNYAENFGANPFGVAFGGLDPSGNPLPGKALPPTSAQQWEIGSKAEFFDGRLRATLAYYDLTKQNVATTDYIAGHECNGGGPLSCTVAVGAVRSKGPELDIQGEILPGWNVIATYANQDVRVTKSNDLQGAAVVGNRLQLTPRNISSVWTTYEAQNGELKGLKIGGGVKLIDSVLDGLNQFKSPGYALVGLLAGYSFNVGKSKVTAQFNIDNLLDKSYIFNAVPISDANYSAVTFSTPRTFMGSINIQY